MNRLLASLSRNSLKRHIVPSHNHRSLRNVNSTPSASDGVRENHVPVSTSPPPLEFHDVPYFEGEGACDEKHKLDVYIPAAPFPRPRCRTCLFVHGGSWQRGDRKHPSVPDHLYGNVGRALAGAGMVGLIMSYRLAPEAKHPEQVKDIARAVRWAKDNVRRYGGDPGDLVLMGHSAGAHLAALCLSDGRWLMEEGVIPDSTAVTPSSRTPSSGSARGGGSLRDGRAPRGRDAPGDHHATPSGVREQSERSFAVFSGFVGISGIYDVPRMAGNVVGRVLADGAFGDERRVWKQASPLHRVRGTSARMREETAVAVVEEAAVDTCATLVASPGVALDGATPAVSSKEEQQEGVAGEAVDSSDTTASALDLDTRLGRATRAALACPLLNVDVLLLTAASDFHLKEDADALARALEEVRVEVLGTEVPLATTDPGARKPSPPGRAVIGPEETSPELRSNGRVRHVCLESEDHLSVMATFGEVGAEATDIVLEFVRNIPGTGARKRAPGGERRGG